MARLEALWSFAGALDKGDLFPGNYERVLCLPTAPWFLCDPVPICKNRVCFFQCLPNLIQ